VISVIPTDGATANMFGGRDEGAGYWWGDLAELIIYDEVLSAGDRAQVEGYLLAKYGIGEKVITPFVSPKGGLFASEIEVSLSTSTQGADIHYTLNGNDPSAASPLYTGPFMLFGTATVKARAFKQGLADSGVATVGFTRTSDFTPKTVSGVKLWWRADAGVASAAGDYWEDQSGAENHGRQVASASTPVLVPNAANGLPVMRFDGTLDFMAFTDRMLSSVRTVFMVVKEDATATASVERSALGDSASSSWDFRGSGTALFGNGSTRVKNGSTFINGTLVPSATVVRPKTLSVIAVIPTDGATADMFGSRDGVAGYWWGDLAELIIYDEVVSPANRLLIESYLKAKYAIP